MEQQVHPSTKPSIPLLGPESPTDPMTDLNPPTKLVFQLWEGEEGIFLPLNDWSYVRAIHDAIESSMTWGEFRAALPEGEWEALDLIVDPALAFDAELLPGFGEGEYPPWLHYALEDELPRSFVDEFGEWARSAVGERWLEFPRTRLAEMSSALETAGFTIVKEAGYD